MLKESTLWPEKSTRLGNPKKKVGKVASAHTSRVKSSLWPEQSIRLEIPMKK